MCECKTHKKLRNRQSFLTVAQIKHDITNAYQVLEDESEGLLSVDNVMEGDNVCMA